MNRRLLLASLLASALAAAAPAFAAEEKKAEEKAAPQDDTFDQDSVLRDAEQFFGRSTEGLAKVIEKAFKDHGRPNAYVKGEEIAGAIAVGLRYGNGTLVLKTGKMRPVWWTGPSIGFDAGANASKVFVLVYHLPRPSAIFQRYPGVDGSFYFVGGAGINYQQRDQIILAPIRLGVGLRAGASVGYMRYTSKKTYNPF
ncbi:MAG TPA: DUF1134 domain-containing protein [Burkholderiales bacterium]